MRLGILISAVLKNVFIILNYSLLRCTVFAYSASRAVGKMGTLEEITKKIDSFSSVINFVFKIAIAIGFLVVFKYYNSLGFFPRDLSVGDSALFVMISLVFGLAYLFMIYSLICLGHILSKIIISPLLILNRYFSRFKGASENNPMYKMVKLKKINADDYPFAFFGVLLFVTHAKSFDSFVGILMATIFSSIAWLVLVESLKGRELMADKFQDLISKPEPKPENERLTKNKGTSLFCCALILVMPIIVTGMTNTIVNGVMRLSEIRNDNVTVYVSQKYSGIIKDNGINGESSSIVKGYNKYTNVNILASAFGADDIIQFTSGEKSITLSIPRSEIYKVR